MRAKKHMACKSREDLDLEENERGFSTYFRGANAAPDKAASSTKRLFKVSTPSPSALLLLTASSRGKTTAAATDTILVPGAGEGVSIRKGWARDTTSASSGLLNNSNNYSDSQQKQHEGRSESTGETSRHSSPHKFAPARSASRHQALPLEMPPDSDLSAALMQHIAELDAQQQASLFTLLNTTNLASATEVKVPYSKETAQAAELQDDNMQSTTPEEEAQQRIRECGLFDPPLSIRIRIFSVWGNSKFASLAGIRLHMDDENGHVNVLKYFTVRVLSGLQLQSPLSDSVRDAPSLFATTHSSSRVVWKGPLDSDSPLEIRLQENSEAKFTESHGGRDHIASRLKISLWNAEESAIVAASTIAKTSLPLPAKDVDVYFGNKCIWTGQLLPTQGGKPFAGKELPVPALSVYVFSTNNSQIVSPLKQQQETLEACAHFPSVSDKKQPSWFDGLRETAENCSAAFSSERSLSTPRPLSACITHDGADVAGLSASQSSYEKMLRRRNPDNIELDRTPEERMNDAFIKSCNDSMTDAQLPMSITVIREANKHNRGRITLVGRSIPQEDGDDDVALNDSIVNESTDGLVLMNTLSAQPPKECSPVTGDDNFTTKLLRNRRIDEVQNAVQTALAGLADIMSDFQQNKRHEGTVTTSLVQRRQSYAAAAGERKTLEDSGHSFLVPVLPRGRELKLEILSTWGDRHYVGLSGIDIFDKTGAILTSPILAAGNKYKREAPCACIENIMVNSQNLSVLPEYDDPRIVTNLIDGFNFTRDDLHMWLAPLAKEGTASESIASVTITFSEEVALSMLRVWNYNKSRTYARRGVRCCRITLDDTLIYNG